jgi:hypothetical protein
VTKTRFYGHRKTPALTGFPGLFDVYVWVLNTTSLIPGQPERQAPIAPKLPLNADLEGVTYD